MLRSVVYAYLLFERIYFLLTLGTILILVYSNMY